MVFSRPQLLDGFPCNQNRKIRPLSLFFPLVFDALPFPSRYFELVHFRSRLWRNHVGLTRSVFAQAAGDPQALLRCLREVPLNALVSVPVKGLEFAPAFGPSIDGVVIDPGDPEDQDFTLQVDTIDTLNNILLRKDVVAKLSRYFRPALCPLLPPCPSAPITPRSPFPFRSVLFYREPVKTDRRTLPSPRYSLLASSTLFFVEEL